VAVILEPMAFGAAGRERQDRIQPIECLNRRLLVGREHGRVLRWIHIQPDHVGGFGLEVGIVRLRVRLELWIVPFGKPYLPVCGWPFDSPRPRWRPLEVAPQSSRIHDEYVVIVGVLVTLVALGALYQRVATHRQRRRFPPPGSLLDVGGHRLHTICRGAGSPLVLLESGIAASSLSWAVVQPEIAKFTRVCAYDRAGLAWSDVASCPRTFDQLVDELSSVLASIAPGGRYLLVGHSFGSFVISAYAARHPQNVVGLVLVDPATEWLTITPERARMLQGGRYVSRIGALLAQIGVVRACLALLSGGAPGVPRRFVKIFGSMTARTLERLVGEVQKLPPDIHPVVQELWCQPKCFAAMADYLQLLKREGGSMGTLSLPREIPVIVISSGNQPPGEIAAHQKLAAHSAAGRQVTAARSAHWVQFDEPELVVEVVKELVDRTNRTIDSIIPSPGSSSSSL
jgi:pimeloyl-ACP methyl ester carboxylesterase